MLKISLITLCAILNSFYLVQSLQNSFCQLPCEFFNETVVHTVCERAEKKCGPEPKCGLDFAVFHLTDDDRQYILDIHNYLRNKVATGHETRGAQPEAANMQIMSYNRELEFIAQCWANTCNGNPLIHDKCRRTALHLHVGQNLGYLNTTSPNLNKIKAIKDLILLWYDEVALFNNSWINNTQSRGPKYVVGHYTQLIWSDSTEIGCAISYYTETLSSRIWHQIILVCNYGPGGNYLGHPVYITGDAASKCPKGSTRNSFYKGLCGESENVKDVPNYTFNNDGLFDLE